jgi:hypothetical protein
MTWYFALPPARVIVWGDKMEESATNERLRGLYWACKECRAVFSEHYTRLHLLFFRDVYIDLSVDTVFLPLGAGEEIVTLRTHRVRHLALDYTWFTGSRPRVMMLVLQDLPALEQLKIVVNEPGSARAGLYSEIYLEDLRADLAAGKDWACDARRLLREAFSHHWKSALMQTYAENIEINQLKRGKWRFPSSGVFSITLTKMVPTLIAAQPPTPR